MTPFKEKKKEQYYKDKFSGWIKTSEGVISSLWNTWVSHPKAKPAYEDKNGFFIYEYETN